MSIMKHHGGRKPTGVVPTTIRIQGALREKAKQYVRSQSGNERGLSGLMCKALMFWMEPKSWILIVGTDREGIINISQHQTEGRCYGKRMNMRIVWQPDAVDGVFYGKTKDTNDPAWCIVKEIWLERMHPFA